MDRFIKWLKKRLQQDLPGMNAQVKMVPPASLKLRMQPIENPMFSSVLLLLYVENNEWKTAFIKRPEYDGPHGGQISLPGGKKEPEDENLIKTALRETFEEIGVNPLDVAILGELSEVQIPVSGFIVRPYVGLIEYVPEFIPDPKEVSRIITTPISLFTQNNVKSEFTFSRNDYAIKAPYYKLVGENLWGATAMMISEFEELLREYDKS